MANLKQLADIKKLLDEKSIKLIAVSKTKPVEDILEIYNAGHKIFGENKVQELTDKHEKLPKDIEWHMIGHLQSNKVKYIAPFVHLIHAVDSLKLLKVIDKEAGKNNRIINCLLQVKIAEEESKFGLEPKALKSLLDSGEFQSLKHIQIDGLMGMASNTGNETQGRNEFRNLKQLFDELKSTYYRSAPEFKELSMGMSGDYLIAIEEGSTMVRVGSLIFGARTYV